jgi:hypothetical protein
MKLSNSRSSRVCPGITGIVAIGALSLAAVAGCGRPSYQLDTAPVKGKVTIDGQPLSSGYVTFVVSRGRASSAEIQPDGSFEMSTYEKGDGAQVGTHPVVVTPVPPDEYQAGPKPIPVPERYSRSGTSGFTAEVKPGEDTFIELKLTTKEEKKK